MPGFYAPEAVVDVLTPNKLALFAEMLEFDKKARERSPGKYTPLLEDTVTHNDITQPVLFHILQTGSVEMIAQVLPVNVTYDFNASKKDDQGNTLLNHLVSNSCQHATPEQLDQIMDGLLTEHPDIFSDANTAGNMPLEVAVKNDNVFWSVFLIFRPLCEEGRSANFANYIFEVRYANFLH